MTLKNSFLNLGFTELTSNQLSDKYNLDEYVFLLQKIWYSELRMTVYQLSRSGSFTIHIITNNLSVNQSSHQQITEVMLSAVKSRPEIIKDFIDKILTEHLRTPSWYVERYCPDCTGIDSMGCNEGLPWYDITEDGTDSSDMRYCERHDSVESANKAGIDGNDSIYQFTVYPLQVFHIKDFCPYPGGRLIKFGDGSAEELYLTFSRFINKSIKDLKVIFDFDGLPGFANSWLDEFIGRMAISFPQVNFIMRGKELSKSDYEHFDESIKEWRSMGVHPNSNFKL